MKIESSNVINSNNKFVDISIILNNNNTFIVLFYHKHIKFNQEYNNKLISIYLEKDFN
jgi:hypothetical protein